MKINSLYISSFGGIKDLTLDFSDGFNVIYGDNENGKSTVMAFIKMMFYGSERGSAQIAKNVRKKYTPWDNSTMAGSITFEHNRCNYRLEREFHSSNSTDKTILCNLDFGTRQAVSADVGSEFFGLTAAAFERSVFINQFGYPESDSAAEGELNSKLSNIVLTGDEGISFDAVNSRLESAKLALMSKSGRAGEYDKNLKRARELKDEIEKTERLQSDYESRANEIRLAEERLSLMKKRAAELKNKISAEQDIKNARKLRDFLDLKKKLDEINEDLKLSDGSVADDVYLGKLRFCISKTQSAESDRNAKLQEVNTLEKSLDLGADSSENAAEDKAALLREEITKLENEKAQYEKRLEALNAGTKETPGKEKIKPLYTAFFVLGVVLVSVLTGVLASVVKSYVLTCVSAAVGALILTCFTAVIFRNRKRAKAAASRRESAKGETEQLISAIADTEKIIFSKKVSLEAINTALNSNKTSIERRQEMLKEEKAKYYELEKEADIELDSLLGLFARYKKADSLNDVLDCIDEIAEKATKQKEIKNQLNFIAKDIGSVSYEEAKSKLAKINLQSASSEDFDTLKSEYEKLNNSITEIIANISESRGALQAVALSAQKTEHLKDDLKTLTEKISAQKQFCDTVDIAADTLRESFAEVRRGYGSVLEKKAGGIFANITGNKYNGMGISKAFDINVSESGNFGGRDIDYLSSGTADQAYLSLRLALSELICDGKEMLPVLLDDALAQYDDGRMTAAIKYLQKYSKDYQIIMFTCHKAISDTAVQNGAKLVAF